jgi:glycosyltransferase involved in cell wall biosynthesis
MLNNKRNLWIFNHYAVTPDLPGGTRHFDFGKELVKRGYEVTIFASGFQHGSMRYVRGSFKKDFIVEELDGVRFVWIKTSPYSGNNWKRVINMLSYSVRAYNVARKLNIEKPDIIIGSSVHLFAVFTAYLLSKKYKTPFIMEVRDLWPQTLIDMGMPKWHPFVIVLGVLERLLYKRANKIITLLPKAHEYIEELGIPKNKIVWIPNGVDLERFNFSKDDSLKCDKSSFIITYTGAIGKANNLDILVKAADILKTDYPKIKFLVVGEGPEKERLVRIVREKNLNNIQFNALVPKNEVSKILYKSDALILLLRNSPLYKYGISLNKLFDYLASGKPIIFSSNSINNPVEEAEAGITVPPDNPEKLAEAIIMLYKMSEEERAEMGRNGRSYVEKYYSIPVLADKLESVIRSLL